MIGCQAPTADPNGRTLIDPTDLIAVADAFNDALNSGDVEAASAMLADDVSWGFPNGVNIEGKDAVTQMLTVTTQIWTTIDQQSGDTNYLGVTGGEQGEEWTALLSWGQATYANEANSVSVPYHQVTWLSLIHI